MKRSRLVCLTIVACLSAGTFMLQAQAKNGIYDQLRRPADAAYYHMPVGLCEDYPEETTTREIIRNDMELLKRSGINLLRISFGWDGIETERGKYDWGFWDDYVKTAVDDYGITLVPYICYTPRWNSTGDSTNYWNHTPVDYEEFGEFVGALVNRYKDRIHSWEIWNEPDIREYWSGDVRELARLVKIGSASVRKADPTAMVICPGLAGNTSFTLYLFRDCGISPYVDVVNLHSYFETWNGDPAEQVVPYINRIADIITQYGAGQSIWMAEVGYSTFRQKDGYVSDSYRAYYDYEHTEAYQAVHLFRTLALLASTNKMAATTWYEIKDLPAGENVIGDINNRNLGVATVGYRAKPAEHALSFFNRFFAAKTRCIDDAVRVERALGSDAELHTFEEEGGSLIVVGWLKTHVHGKRSADMSGMVKDTRKETVTLSIPRTLGTKATRYTELGESSPFTAFSEAEGRLLLKDIPLTGGSIFIVKIAK